MPVTFTLRRFDETKLREALAALAAAREKSDPEPLFPWLEGWQIDGVLSEKGLAQEDYLALFDKCIVGRAVDLLDRSPAMLAGAQADADLRAALAGLEKGKGLEAWMRDEDVEARRPGSEGMTGLLCRDEVLRLEPRIKPLACEEVLPEDDERVTYAAAWTEVRRTFTVAAHRREGIALFVRA